MNGQGKERWSPFGRMLHQEFLNKIGMSQTQLAQETGIDLGIINHMMAGHPVGYGQGEKCIERLYNILDKLWSHMRQLNMPLYSDRVRALLKCIPENNLTIEERENLISTLIQEGIVKPIYYTDKGIPFIGRDKDIDAVITKLNDRQLKRFVTLVGAPGVGKTELAKQVQTLAKEQGFEELFLSLEHATNINIVLKEIQNILMNVSPRQRTLLILDNCEEITDREGASKEISNLLDNYPQLWILATSRYDFSPRPHKVETLEISDAEQLFREGYYFSASERYEPSSQEEQALLTQICQLLDGLPLALLIASAWLWQKGIEGLYDSLLDMSIETLRLPGLPERHVTLSALIGYSYDLLAQKEQKLLRWLSAFPSNCQVEAIIAICEKGEFYGFPVTTQEQLSKLQEDLIPILDMLRKHHLITYQSNVIGMHNIIRYYGRRLLNTIKAQGDETVEETKKLLRLLLWYNSQCRRHIYLRYVYDLPGLLGEANFMQFLENGNEDNKTIKERIDNMLLACTYEGVDCFRRYHPFYSSMLDEMIRQYQMEAKTARTGDDRRNLFFTYFDATYTGNLENMLDEEANGFFVFLVDHYDLNHIWAAWDSRTKNLIGLTTSNTCTIAAPGNVVELGAASAFLQKKSLLRAIAHMFDNFLK